MGVTAVGDTESPWLRRKQPQIAESRRGSWARPFRLAAKDRPVERLGRLDGQAVELGQGGQDIRRLRKEVDLYAALEPGRRNEKGNVRHLGVEGH